MVCLLCLLRNCLYILCLLEINISGVGLSDISNTQLHGFPQFHNAQGSFGVPVITGNFSVGQYRGYDNRKDNGKFFNQRSFGRNQIFRSQQAYPTQPQSTPSYFGILGKPYQGQ